MKISLLQTDIRWLSPAENIVAAERLMDSAGEADLYVLPEMWATGFNTSPDYEMIDMAHEALEWMRRQAHERQCAVAGTVAVRDWPSDEAPRSTCMWRNRFYFVRPDGSEAHYDKRNLFTYGGEQLTYAPGAERVIVEWRGVRFMLQTCFDLRFPEAGRNFLADAYDVLLYAANWPTSRQAAWDALLVARAIENQAYCAGVNRTGSDPACLYSGGSAAIDPYGKLIFRMNEEEQAICFEPDLDRLRAFRQKFKVLR